MGPLLFIFCVPYLFTNWVGHCDDNCECIEDEQTNKEDVSHIWLGGVYVLFLTALTQGVDVRSHYDVICVDFEESHQNQCDSQIPILGQFLYQFHLKYILK